MCEELSDIWQQDMTNESEAWDKKNWNEHGQIDKWVFFDIVQYELFNIPLNTFWRRSSQYVNTVIFTTE